MVKKVKKEQLGEKSFVLKNKDIFIKAFEYGIKEQKKIADEYDRRYGKKKIK